MIKSKRSKIGDKILDRPAPKFPPELNDRQQRFEKSVKESRLSVARHSRIQGSANLVKPLQPKEYIDNNKSEAVEKVGSPPKHYKFSQAVRIEGSPDIKEGPAQKSFSNNNQQKDNIMAENDYMQSQQYQSKEKMAYTQGLKGEPYSENYRQTHSSPKGSSYAGGERNESPQREDDKGEDSDSLDDYGLNSGQISLQEVQDNITKLKEVTDRLKTTDNTPKTEHTLIRSHQNYFLAIQEWTMSNLRRNYCIILT